MVKPLVKALNAPQAPIDNLLIFSKQSCVQLARLTFEQLFLLVSITSGRETEKRPFFFIVLSRTVKALVKHLDYEKRFPINFDTANQKLCK
jgi:hypothetical protein